ncbi:MAG: acyltransferase family protein [Janthinobacterium lividum]
MSKRIPELDGLRALAIIAVFVGHALRFRMMWIGVDLFFVLSGFLITGILLDAPKVSFRAYIAHFYERRVRRILPPYLLILVVMSLIFGTVWMRHWYLYIGLMNYTGYFWHEDSFNALGPLWSLAVEEQFYLFWPVIVFFLGVKRLPKVLIACIVLAPLLRGAFTPWLSHQAFDTYHWVIYKGAPFRCDCLAMGALMTFVWRAHAEKIRRYGYLGLIPAALTPPVMYFLGRTLVGFTTFGTSVVANIFIYEISLCAVTGVLLWALSGRFTGLLTVAPMRWLARLSYSFYLVHEGMLELFARYFHSAAAIAVGAAAISLIYAELSWRFLESPILHGGNRKVAKRELEAAETHPTQEIYPASRDTTVSLERP